MQVHDTGIEYAGRLRRRR